MLPLPGSSSTTSAQAPPLILLLLPLTDTHTRDELSATVTLSCTCLPKVAWLTACLCVAAVCSDLSASPCTSSAAQPSGRGTLLPPHPVHPETFY